MHAGVHWPTPDTHCAVCRLQELHNYQIWLVSELLDLLQWVRAECAAFPGTSLYLRILNALNDQPLPLSCMQVCSSIWQY